MVWSDIIESAHNKYLNMVFMGAWDTVDLCDANSMALTTEIQSLKSNAILASHAQTGSKSNRGDPSTPNLNQTIISCYEKWCTTKKGNFIQVNGNDFYCCPHHEHPSRDFDGL